MSDVVLREPGVSAPGEPEYETVWHDSYPEKERTFVVLYSNWVLRDDGKEERHIFDWEYADED